MTETQEPPKASHWTHRLFVDHAELYLPFLEQAKERAEDEVAALVAIFDELGVPKGGKVLDVACGIGRHSVLLAQKGYRVTAMDLSPLFIYEAKQNAALAGVSLNFVVGDVLAAQDSVGKFAPYDAVINMFTSHGYYGRDADLDLFAQLHKMAAPDSALVVLTVNRDWVIRHFTEESLAKAGDIRILQRRKLELETSSIINDWEFYSGQDKELELRLKLEMEHRLYSLHELIELVESAGWRYVQSYGRMDGDEFKLGPLTYDSNSIWLVSRG